MSGTTSFIIGTNDQADKAGDLIVSFVDTPNAPGTTLTTDGTRTAMPGLAIGTYLIAPNISPQPGCVVTMPTSGTTPPPSNVPPAAAGVGFTTRTFNSLAVNGMTGSWKNNSGIQIVNNSDGSITLGPGGTHSGHNADICSAWATSGAGFPFSGGVGAASGSMFGGGGYFEATASWTGTTTNQGGWPAFWSDDIEGQSADPSIAWSGGNSLWFEPDIMETFGPGAYGNTCHAWWSSTYPQGTNDGHPGFPSITWPAGFDPTKAHKYGMLWVPATPNISGYLQFYLDGVPNNRVSYPYWNPAAPPAPPPQTQTGANATSNVMGFMDTKHLFLFLGTGPQNPMTVYAVEVWQKDASRNIVR
jgi:hypothetical protein